MKRFVLKIATLAVPILLAIAAPKDSRNTGALTPVLGNYPNAALPLSSNTTVTPDAPPTNTTRINVSTSTSFNGTLEASPVTGVVRISNAHPAGTYTVTVRAFDSGGASTTKTFTLTVTTPTTCNPVTFAPATLFPAGHLPLFVVVGDFNGDGKQDLAVANQGTPPNYSDGGVSILLGDGAGHFSTPTEFSAGNIPVSLAVDDFNGDGIQDLAIATRDSSGISIRLGNGDGTFQTSVYYATGSGPVSIAVGDFNGDGYQDLAVANTTSNNVSILLGDGTGHFDGRTDWDAGIGPSSVAIGDFNGDGKQDLAVTNSYSNNVSILLGDGTGEFSTPTNFPTDGGTAVGMVVGDFNGDGYQDLAVAGSNNVAILLGDGTGSFSAPRNIGGGSGYALFALGDFDGDGKQDLALANGSILLGTGDGGFIGPVNIIPSGPIAVGDFNNDGNQDLAIPTSSGVSILFRDCGLFPTGAISQKPHGFLGTFNIDLPLTGTPGVECRSGGATNDYVIWVYFSRSFTVNGNPQAQVTMGTGMVGMGGVSNGGMVSIFGNSVWIPLTNVANAQTINVTLFGVNGSGNGVIPMNVLVGDVSGNGTVNATDIAQTKARIGQPIDQTNFRFDVNANGNINAGDIAIIKSNLGSGLP